MQDDRSQSDPNEPVPAWATDPAGFSPTPQYVPPPHPFYSDFETATPRSVFVPTLIAINIVVYVAMGLSGIGWITPHGDTIPWGVDYWPLTTHGQWWRLLTSAFVHFGIFHIGLNMWALYAVGKFTERLFGNFFFLLIYLLTAVLSGLTSIWFEHNNVTAGASGAIFAIYGALLAYLVFQRGAFPTGAVAKLLRSTLGFVAINIVFGFSTKGISNSAHLGGLVTGFILGAVFARPLDRTRRRQQTLPKLAAGLFLGAAMATAGLAFIPKCNFDIYADKKLLATIQPLADDEKAAGKATNALLNASKAGKLDDMTLAAQLEKDVIPIWASMVDRLKAIPVSATSGERPLYDDLLKYCELNRDAFKSFAAAIHDNDAAKLQDYEAKMKEATALQTKFKSEIPTEPPEGD